MTTMNLILRCAQCNISFSDRESFNTHKEKFCVGSLYSSPEKLAKQLEDDDKTEQALQQGDVTVREISDYVSGRDSMTKSRYNAIGEQLGAKSLAQLRQGFLSSDKQTRILLKEMEGSRKRNKADELKALKARYQRERMQHNQSDAELTQLMEKLEKDKRKTLKRKMERQRIQRQMAELNRTNLATLEEEKRAELSLLSNDMLLLSEREAKLKAELSTMQKNLRQGEKEFQENIKKLETAASKRSTKSGDSVEIFSKAQVEAAAEFGERKATLAAERKALELRRAGVKQRLKEIETFKTSDSTNSKVDKSKQLARLVKSVEKNIDEDVERVRNMRALAEQQGDISEMLDSPMDLSYGNFQETGKVGGKKKAWASSYDTQGGSGTFSRKRSQLGKAGAKVVLGPNKNMINENDKLRQGGPDEDDDSFYSPRNVSIKTGRRVTKAKEARIGDLENELNDLENEYNKQVDSLKEHVKVKEHTLKMQMRSAQNNISNQKLKQQKITEIQSAINQIRFEYQYQEQQLRKQLDIEKDKIRDRGIAANLADFEEERQEQAEWQDHHMSLAKEHNINLQEHKEAMDDHEKSLENHATSMRGTNGIFVIQRMQSDHRKAVREITKCIKSHEKDCKSISDLYTKLLQESPENEELDDTIKRRLQRRHMHHQESMQKQQQKVQEQVSAMQRHTNDIISEQIKIKEEQQQKRQQQMGGNMGQQTGNNMGQQMGNNMGQQMGGMNPMLMQMMMMPMQMMMMQQQMQQQMSNQGTKRGNNTGHLDEDSTIEHMRLQHEIEQAAFQREQEELEKSRREFQETLDALKDINKPKLGGGVSSFTNPGAIGAPQSAHAAEMVEMMSVINSLDKDSTLYKMHMQHMEEKAKMKFDLEKIETQKKVQNAQHTMSLQTAEVEKKMEYTKWVSDMKREVTQLRMERKLHSERAALQQQAKTHGTGELSRVVSYNQQNGFLAYWDYLAAIPAKFTHCRIVYGIFCGIDKVKEMVSTVIKDCSPGVNGTPGMVQCLLIEKTKRIKLPSNPETRLVIEVQHCSVLPTGPNNAGHFDSIGWTTFPLFNVGGALMEGEWRMFMRQPPVSLTQDIETLPLVEGLELNMRIVQGALETAADSMAIDPFVTSHLYRVFKYDMLKNINDAEGKRQGMEKNDTLREKELLALLERREKERDDREKEQEMRKKKESGQDEEADRAAAKLEVEAELKAAKSTPDGGLGIGPDDGNFGAGPVSLKVLNMSTLKDQGLLIVKAEIWGGKNIWKSAVEGVGGYLFETGEAKCENNGSFMKKKLEYIWNEDDPDDWNLTHLTMGQPPSIVLTVHKAKGYPNDPIMWGSLFDIKAALGKKICKVKMYDTPVSKPFKRKYSKRKESSDKAVLSVSLTQEDTLEERKQKEANAKEEEEIAAQQEKKEKTKKGKDKKEKNKKTVEKKDDTIEDVAEDDEPENIDINELVGFLNVKRTDPPKEKFTSSDGFELYIDGCRWLPDSTTLCRVKVSLHTSDWTTQDKPSFYNAHLNSPVANPIMRARCEFHSGDYKPTSTLLFRIDTIEEVTMKYKCIGYAVHNVFCNQSDMKTQPKDDNVKSFSLNAGLFQLPLFQSPPKSKKALSINALTKLVRLPCASILIRIKQSITNQLGDLVSTEGMTFAEALSEGIIEDVPHYNERVYDSSLCQPSKSERELYKIRKEKGPGVIVEEILDKVVEDEDIQQDLRDPDKLELWFKKQKNPDGMIDSRFLVKYQEKMGFKVSIDAMHNLKGSVVFSSGLHTAIYCLNPPAAFYQDPALTDEVEFLHKVKKDSLQKSPQFEDGFKTFTDTPYDDETCLLIDVRRVDLGAVHKGKRCLKTVGWTALPIFNEHEYVMSDSYILPLYQGQLTEEIVDELSQEDTPKRSIDKLLRKGKIKLTKEHSSVLVRLLDVQLVAEKDEKIPLITLSENLYKSTYLPKAREVQEKYGLVFKKKIAHFDRSMIPTKGKILNNLTSKNQTFEDLYIEANEAIAKESEITHYKF